MTTDYESYLKGKTYLQVIKKSGDYIFFDPCDSNILKYKFGDTFYINVGQDEIKYPKWQIKRVINDSIYIEVYKEPKWEEILKFRLDTINKFLYNRNNVFIDSIVGVDIPYTKEPCENCWDKELCDEWAKQEKEKTNIIDTKWHGKYSYKTTPYKLDSLSSIPIFYDLNIKKDSILFSGQGYKTDFYDLCFARQNVDTLEIYYSKTIEGTNYNKDEKASIAKLYKNGDNFFIISSVIEDGKIKKDIPVLIKKEK